MALERQGLSRERIGEALGTPAHSRGLQSTGAAANTGAALQQQLPLHQAIEAAHQLAMQPNRQQGHQRLERQLLRLKLQAPVALLPVGLQLERQPTTGLRAERAAQINLALPKRQIGFPSQCERSGASSAVEHAPPGLGNLNAQGHPRGFPAGFLAGKLPEGTAGIAA